MSVRRSSSSPPVSRRRDGSSIGRNFASFVSVLTGRDLIGERIKGFLDKPSLHKTNKLSAKSTKHLTRKVVVNSCVSKSPHDFSSSNGHDRFNMLPYLYSEIDFLVSRLWNIAIGNLIPM
jgi:hypothetical protein